eukprot:2189791-Prymnesium_polylepis.1
MHLTSSSRQTDEKSAPESFSSESGSARADSWLEYNRSCDARLPARACDAIMAEIRRSLFLVDLVGEPGVFGVAGVDESVAESAVKLSTTTSLRTLAYVVIMSRSC